MELKIDIGEILAGVAAVLSAWAALRERSRKSEPPIQKPPEPLPENLPTDSAAKLQKPFTGQVLSDSGFMRLGELLESSEKDGE